MMNKTLPDEAAADWKVDHGEQARRIWEWWHCRILGNNRFVHFRHALRLVVLSQTSSCSVECAVFSQLKLVRDACGVMHEVMLELRMLCRCNDPNLVPL